MRQSLVLTLSLLLHPRAANGIPIEGWTHDPSDEALLDLLPVLDSLRFAQDVRHVLGLRITDGKS
jgi:TFIIF-interacting CTD phosphatase-like protein